MLFRTLRKSVPFSLFLRPPEFMAFPNRERDWLGPTRVPITDIYIGVSAFATPASRRGPRRFPRKHQRPENAKQSSARCKHARCEHGTCHAVPGTAWHVPCSAGSVGVRRKLGGQKHNQPRAVREAGCLYIKQQLEAFIACHQATIPANGNEVVLTDSRPGSLRATCLSTFP